MRLVSVKDILNRVASECGLSESDAPLANNNREFRQIRTLMNSAAEELRQLRPWKDLNQTHTIKTQKTDSGRYPLPVDFEYMIPQTHWDTTDDSALHGPLSNQIWVRKTVKGEMPLKIQFRMNKREFQILPLPVPEDHNVQFDYSSDLWLRSADNTTRHEKITDDDSLLCLLPVNLLAISTKAKFKEAKGMSSGAAREEFATNYFSSGSHDEGAPTLNAGNYRSEFRLLDVNNIPEKGYGVA